MIKQNRFKKILCFGLFILCLVYWGYLFKTASMSISQDAVGYERLGRILADYGIDEYLRPGLTREPLYPYLISLSMKIGDQFSISYQEVQKFFQLLILFVSQLLLFFLLGQLKIDWRIQYGATLYYGVSPAMTNAALSLYSEILAFPFVILIVLGMFYSWRQVRKGEVFSVCAAAFIVAVAFIAVIFVKAVFQYIFAAYLCLYFVLFVRGLFKWNSLLIRNILIYLVISTTMVGLSVYYYRHLNLKNNGHFDFANRYDNLLFGNAGKRVADLTSRQVLAHFLIIPGENVCKKFLSNKECLYATFQEADYYRSTYLPKYLNQVAEKDRQKETLAQTLKLVLKKPIQYGLMSFLESLKMGFWESTRIGYVEYSQLMDQIYNNEWIKSGIRLIVSVLTYLGLLTGIWFVFKNQKTFLSDASEVTVIRQQQMFFIVMLIVLFTALYSLFSILTRFALPIASLYIVCIAFFINMLLERGDIQKGKNV